VSETLCACGAMRLLDPSRSCGRGGSTHAYSRCAVQQDPVTVFRGAPAPPPSTGGDLLSFIRREREKWRSGPKAAFGLLSAPEMVELFDHLEHLASAPPSTGDEARGEIERLVDKLIGVVAARKAVGRVTPFDKRTKEHSARAALLAAVSRALAATNPEPETKEIDR
jgi:hypothetical protein